MIRVFISSVQAEFAEERKLLCDYIRQDALLGRFFSPFIFEELPAINLSAPEAYLTEAQSSDIYLGLYGERYGYEDAEGISPTEREYDTATAASKFRMVFIKQVADRHPKEQRLIQKVEQQVVRKAFADYEELRTAVYASLVRYLEEKEYLRLLPWDATLHTSATLADIDPEKVQWFVKTAQEKRNFPLTINDGTEKILKHLDLLSDDDRLTNSALLLFGKRPQHFFPASEVKCAQFYGFKVEKPVPYYQVFRGNLFELVDQAVGFVMNHIDAAVGTRSQSTSVDIDYELPVEAVREAIVNACVHRSYESNGSVQVMLFRDRLEVWSPGSLPMGITLDKLTTTHRSIPVNPTLATPVYLAGYIERLGTGTTDILEKCRAKGLRNPVFNFEGDFNVTIWRKEEETTSDPVANPISNPENAGANAGANAGVNAGVNLNKTQKHIVELISRQPDTTYEAMATAIGVNPATIFRNIAFLKEHNIIRRIGEDKNGHWEVEK